MFVGNKDAIFMGESILHKLKDSALTIQLEAQDPDHPNDTSKVQFSLQNPVTGISLSLQGLLSWSSDANTNLSINVILTDGCGSSLVQQVSLVVVECPCRNFGTCSPVPGTQPGSSEFGCHCRQGTSGQLCETDTIDSCTPNPCGHGMCFDKPTDYVCDCGDGQLTLECSTTTHEEPSTMTTSAKIPDTTSTSATSTQTVSGASMTDALATTQKAPDTITTDAPTTTQTQKVPDTTITDAPTTTQKESDTTITDIPTTTQKAPDTITTDAPTTIQTQPVPDTTITDAPTTTQTQKAPDTTITDAPTATQKAPDTITTDAPTTIQTPKVPDTTTTDAPTTIQTPKVPDTTITDALTTTPNASDTTVISQQTMEPSVASWSSWTRWSNCSRTCDYGLQTRQRHCNNNQDTCEGSNTQKEQCILTSCIGKFTIVSIL